MILQIPANGALENISPANLPALVLRIINLSLLNRTGSTFFTVDGERLEWPCNQITGHTIRKLGDVAEGKKTSA